jgi:hypothetical protein
VEQGLEVVYRAGTKEALEQAVTALRASGTGMRVLWSPGAIGGALVGPTGKYGSSLWTPGEGTILVLPEDAARAREVLAAWEAESERRVREHTEGLPRDVRRLVTVFVAILLASWLIAGLGAKHPVATVAIAALLLGLVVWEVRSTLARRTARATELEPGTPADRWFPK